MTKENSEAKKHMSPGEALDWMIRNPGKDLHDSKGRCWVVVNIDGKGTLACMSDEVGEKRYVLDLTESYWVPKRKLPDLRLGYVWREWRERGSWAVFKLADQSMPDGVASFVIGIDSNEYRDAAVAAVQEFDGRPL